MTRKLDTRHDERQHAAEAASDTTGGAAVALWLLAVLLAQILVILWIAARMYAP